MNHGQPLLFLQPPRLGSSLIIIIPKQSNFHRLT
eukprot:CCRYP_013427-RA/>CCRYP_013427-RA protein AED:0.29 eAED:0.29 QI:142/1/0.5/1/0/0/2/0/33